jgi:hypothetical protein
MTAAAAVLFHHDAQIFHHLHGRVGRRERGVQPLSHALDGEARHHRQHFEQAIARGSRLGGLQQPLAVGRDIKLFFNTMSRNERSLSYL